MRSNYNFLCLEYEGRLKEFVEEKKGKGENIKEGNMREFGERLLVEARETVERSFLGKLEKKLLKERLE